MIQARAMGCPISMTGAKVNTPASRSRKYPNQTKKMEFADGVDWRT